MYCVRNYIKIDKLFLDDFSVGSLRSKIYTILKAYILGYLCNELLKIYCAMFYEFGHRN